MIYKLQDMKADIDYVADTDRGYPVRLTDELKVNLLLAIAERLEAIASSLDYIADRMPSI